MKLTLPTPFYYKVKTQLGDDGLLNNNIFSNENIFEARDEAFRFVAHLLEILFDEDKLKFTSNVLTSFQINSLVNELKEDNFCFSEFLNDSRFLAIDLIPDQSKFPNGIEIFFVLNQEEFLIQSYKSPNEICFNNIIENLRTEYHYFLKEGYDLNHSEIILETGNLTCCDTSDRVAILKTYYGWNSPIRILGINLLYNAEAYTNKIIELMINPNFKEIAFLETWKWKEIKTNILSLHHTKGGILFMGYHPENFTEHIIPPSEIDSTITSLSQNIQLNLDCSDSIEIKKINFKGIDVIAIIVFPIAHNKYKKLIASNQPIYLRTDQKIIIDHNHNNENNNQLNSNIL